MTTTLASTINPHAGWHAISPDPQDIEAARRAGEASLAEFPYYRERWGDRAGLFGRGTVGEGNDVESLELPGRVANRAGHVLLAFGETVGRHEQPRDAGGVCGFDDHSGAARAPGHE